EMRAIIRNDDARQSAKALVVGRHPYRAAEDQLSDALLLLLADIQAKRRALDLERSHGLIRASHARCRQKRSENQRPHAHQRATACSFGRAALRARLRPLGLPALS